MDRVLMVNFDEEQYFDYAKIDGDYKEINGGSLRDLIMKLIVLSVHNYDAIYIEDFGTTINLLEKDDDL
jgi:hypothetical protein